MRCGFIGLGNQGGPMARRMIDAGYELVLWARRPETLEPFADTSAIKVPSIATLAEQVEYCGVCVVDDAGVQQVCDELIPAMAPGGCVAIHSTVHPELCKTLAAQAAERGLMFVDAPVSGGGAGAAAGALTVMVGGDSLAVETVRPVFETFAGLVVHLGEVGAGQMAKLVNNAMMAANLAIAHYSLEAAAALNINAEAFARLVKASSGRSFAFDVRERMPDPTAFNHGANLLMKDVHLLGESLGNAQSFESIRDVAKPFLELALAE